MRSAPAPQKAFTLWTPPKIHVTISSDCYLDHPGTLARDPHGKLMNWTSTKVPLWQIECENLRRSLKPFELRDVTPEHNAFIEAFTTLYHLKCIREGSVITFYPELPGTN